MWVSSPHRSFPLSQNSSLHTTPPPVSQDLFSWPTAKNDLSSLSMALVLPLPSSTLTATSCVHYISRKSFHFCPKSCYMHFDTSQERELGPWHRSPSPSDITLSLNTAKQISACMAIYILLIYTTSYIHFQMENTDAPLLSQARDKRHTAVPGSRFRTPTLMQTWKLA